MKPFGVVFHRIDDGDAPPVGAGLIPIRAQAVNGAFTRRRATVESTPALSPRSTSGGERAGDRAIAPAADGRARRR